MAFEIATVPVVIQYLEVILNIIGGITGYYNKLSTLKEMIESFMEYIRKIGIELNAKKSRLQLLDQDELLGGNVMQHMDQLKELLGHAQVLLENLARHRGITKILKPTAAKERLCKIRQELQETINLLFLSLMVPLHKQQSLPDLHQHQAHFQHQHSLPATGSTHVADIHCVHHLPGHEYHYQHTALAPNLNPAHFNSTDEQRAHDVSRYCSPYSGSNYPAHGPHGSHSAAGMHNPPISSDYFAGRRQEHPIGPYG